MKWAHKKQDGFTIVELLIVVVVIAILAAITIVAYNGIKNRAEESGAKSTTSQYFKKLAVYFESNNYQYPADSAALTTLLKYTLGENDRYIVNNTLSPAQFCLSITTTTPANSYSVSSTSSTPIKGTCVTNLSDNPSFETTGPNGAHYNASSSNATGAGVTSGNNGLQIHSTRTANGEAMRFIQGGFGTLGNFTPGTSYNFSLDMTPLGAFAASAASQRQILFRWAGTANGGLTSAQATNTATTQRLSIVGQAPVSTTTGIMLQVNHYGVATDPDIVIDSVMVTEGTSRYAYGDGSKQGWWWTGVPHLSTSVGPAQLVE